MMGLFEKKKDAKKKLLLRKIRSGSNRGNKRCKRILGDQSIRVRLRKMRCVGRSGPGRSCGTWYGHHDRSCNGFRSDCFLWSYVYSSISCGWKSSVLWQGSEKGRG